MRGVVLVSYAVSVSLRYRYVFGLTLWCLTDTGNAVLVSHRHRYVFRRPRRVSHPQNSLKNSQYPGCVLLYPDEYLYISGVGASIQRLATGLR